MAAAFTSESATGSIDRPTVRLLVRSAVFAAGFLVAVLLSMNDAQADERAEPSQPPAAGGHGGPPALASGESTAEVSGEGKSILSGLLSTAKPKPRGDAAESGESDAARSGAPDAAETGESDADASGAPDTAAQRPADRVQQGAQSVQQTVGAVVETADDVVRHVQGEAEKVAEPTRGTVEETVTSVGDTAGELPGGELPLPDETLPLEEEPPAAPAETTPGETTPGETGPAPAENPQVQGSTRSTGSTRDRGARPADPLTRRLTHDHGLRPIEHSPDGPPVVTAADAPSLAGTQMPKGSPSSSLDSGASDGQSNAPVGDEPVSCTGCAGAATPLFAAMTGWQVPDSGWTPAMAHHRTACSTGPVIQPGFSPD